MTGRRGIVAVVLVGAVGCGSSQADRVCTIAGSVAADTSVAPAERGAKWVERAHAAVDDPRLRRVLEQASKSESMERDVIEAAFTDAIGKPWTCPALDQVLSPP